MAGQTRTKRKQKDPFASLRPKVSEVPVGDSILTIRTATLEQESKLMSLLTDLDLGSLLGPLSEILSMNVDDDEKDNSALSVLPKLGAVGPQIWEAAQRLLGHQFVPAMRGCAVALLDTKSNKKLLVGLDVIDISAEDDVDDHGVFNGCASVRTWIAEELTLVQATHIVKTAFELNGYLEVMGNLIPLTMPAAVAQGMDEGAV